jgi:hypothetical protein
MNPLNLLTHLSNTGIWHAARYYEIDTTEYYRNIDSPPSFSEMLQESNLKIEEEEEEEEDEEGEDEEEEEEDKAKTYRVYK